MLGDALCDEYSLSRCPRMAQEHCNQMGVWGGRTPCSMDSFFLALCIGRKMRRVHEIDHFTASTQVNRKSMVHSPRVKVQQSM